MQNTVTALPAAQNPAENLFLLFKRALADQIRIKRTSFVQSESYCKLSVYLGDGQVTVQAVSYKDAVQLMEEKLRGYVPKILRKREAQ